MKIKTGNLIVAVAFAVTFLVVIVSVQSAPLAARRMPVVVGALGLILSCILAIKEVRSRKGQERNILAGPEKKDALSLKALIALGGWMAGVVAAVYLFSFWAGLALYTFLYHKLHGGTWMMSAILAAGMAAFIYFVLMKALVIPFPDGAAFTLLGW